MLALPVLLVVVDKLGVINHTLLVVEAIKRRGLHLAGVVLNRFMTDTDSGMDNPTALSRWLGCPVAVTFRYDSDADLAIQGIFPTLPALADRLVGGL
ncbi:MAG: AAA family ATPase [Methylosarcina sp.]